MTARRLPTTDPSSSPPRRRVRSTFDGRSFEGIDGEPLAFSLLAADRVVLSRSFRFHRPRGLMCSTGQCGWCECAVDGRPSVRTCRVPMREGIDVRGEHAFPSVQRDLFGWLDLGSRLVPPTFYHHRFLRPRALRKRYLDVLRAFGGRGRLRIGRAGGVGAAARERAELEVDVLVVGGGRRGRAAARAAAAAAGGSVALVEASETLAGGGVELPGVRVLTGTTAIGWYDGVVAAIGPITHWTIRARAVVAATGSYERVPAVRGADRPGVMGARLALELIERHRILPGERPLLVGEPAELAPLVAAFVAAGVTVIGPIPEDTLRRIHGRRRVTGAVLAGAGGHDRRVDVDLVAFSARTPNLDLVLAAGAAVERRGGVVVPVLDGEGRTTVPGLSVVGSAAGGRRASDSMASPATDDAPATDVAPAEPPDRALVCFCEDVHYGEIRAQCAAGYGDPELVKRRTGALTGPCQGKYCLQAFAGALEGCGIDDPARALPTVRPPLHPTRLGDLVPAAPAAPATPAADATPPEPA